jgi:hypothetical protein
MTPATTCKKSGQCCLSVAMTTNRSVTALATNPASPTPSLPRRVLDRRRRAIRPRHSSVPPITTWPPAPPPLRGPAKGHSPACRQPPCRGLNHARGCATGFAAPAIAVAPATTFGFGWPQCMLPAACAVGFAHGPVGYLTPGLLAALVPKKAAPGYMLRCAAHST